MSPIMTHGSLSLIKLGSALNTAVTSCKSATKSSFVTVPSLNKCLRINVAFGIFTLPKTQFMTYPSSDKVHPSSLENEAAEARS